MFPPQRDVSRLSYVSPFIISGLRASHIPTVSCLYLLNCCFVGHHFLAHCCTHIFQLLVWRLAAMCALWAHAVGCKNQPRLSPVFSQNLCVACLQMLLESHHTLVHAHASFGSPFFDKRATCHVLHCTMSNVGFRRLCLGCACVAWCTYWCAICRDV